MKRKSVKGLVVLLLTLVMVIGSTLTVSATNHISINSNSAGLILEAGDCVHARAAGGFFVYVDKAYGDTSAPTYSIDGDEWVLGEWESYKVIGVSTIANQNGDLAAHVWVESITPFEQVQSMIIKKVAAAPENGTVIINSGETLSMNRASVEALQKRPDVTLALNFIYKGVDYTVTIPAGTDWKAVAGNSIWVGFLYLNSMFGGKEGTTVYDELSLNKEYATLDDMSADLSDALDEMAEGGSLTINTGNWFYFGPSAIETLKENNTVNLTIDFKYQSKSYSVTIPAGTDWGKIAGDSKFLGFMYLNSLF